MILEADIFFYIYIYVIYMTYVSYRKRERDIFLKKLAHTIVEAGMYI